MIKIPFCAALTAVFAFHSSAFADEAGWVSLFNGKDLSGWSIKSGKATYKVEGDAIVGTTEKGSPNTFLVSDKQYANFEIQFDVKVHN